MDYGDILIPLPRFPEYHRFNEPLFTLEKPVFTEEEVQSMIDKENAEKLFCYKCNTHVNPIRKRGESILYFDIEALPIIDELSYCPICEEEVYDRDYEMLVIMSKLTVLNKRERFQNDK
ncbi:MAG: hypothetical protein KQ78_00832 [Candidatus Izimaplasma bacterium HR2]|nr:MAG: hypothetical protein KQ78_00832 [Candidatus Izimaplasma bacterium HR2]